MRSRLTLLLFLTLAGPALAAALVAPARYGNVLFAAIGIYLLVICLMILSVRVAPRN